MEKKIIAGIASFGMSGKVFHAPLLSAHPGFRLKTIVERSKHEAKTLYPDVEIVNSIDTLFNDKEIELVIINTPDHTHAEIAHRALMARKNVVVEKPFTLQAGEGEDLLNLAVHKKKLLSVFHNRRWDGDFMTVKKIIENGLLGRLVEYEAHFDRFRNYIQPSWKEDASVGTGTIYNLGSHLIDQALVLFGMPEAVYADIRVLRTDGSVDDFFDINLYYTGLKVTLKASYLVKELGPKYHLNGTLGSYIKYGLDPQEEALKKGSQPTGKNWGKEPKKLWGILNTEKAGLPYRGPIETVRGNYMAYYDNIHGVLTKDKNLIVKPEEAINVIKIIETALESSRAGKKMRL